MNQLKIGEFISSSRKAKNLTQEQLAEKLNINNRTISRWENGKNMPDISLFKPLCEILEISVEELINGEKTNKNNLTKSYENAIISTINTNQKLNKKTKKLIRIFLILIVIILSISVSIIIYYQNKYPKIDIYNLSPITSAENKLNNNLTITTDNTKIYFYGIDSLQLGDSKYNYFDLKQALKYKQTSINELRKYLESQYNNGYIERYSLDDGGSKIYKSKKYEAIICNTIEGNSDIYFGTPNIEKNLKGAYCGREESIPCSFTRTYHIQNITDDNDYDFINVTLMEFQGEIAMVRIKRSSNIQVGKNYEFTFTTYEIFENNINNIFTKSTLIEVKETAKVGLEQINEKICINS